MANGLEVAESLEVAEMLMEDGIDAKVINIHTIKPLDEELIFMAAKEIIAKYGLDAKSIYEKIKAFV